MFPTLMYSKEIEQFFSWYVTLPFVGYPDSDRSSAKFVDILQKLWETNRQRDKNEMRKLSCLTFRLTH